MRIRLPLQQSGYFLAALVLALLVLLPMRLVLGWLGVDAHGLAAREAYGSVWRGGLVEARFAGAPLGDLGAGLSPLPLLTGQARIGLRRMDVDGGQGAISLFRHGMGFDHVTARLAAGRRFAPLPIVSLDLRDVSVRFRDGLCEKADGLVKADIDGRGAGLTLPGGLIGTVRCDQGALLLPLASQSGMETLAFHLSGDGHYRAEMNARPSTPETLAALSASGFTAAGDRYRLAFEGTM